MSTAVASWFQRYTDRIFVFYGRTDDEFCLPTLEILGLAEVLTRHLRGLGYRRIVYYDGQRKVHFADDESLRLARPERSEGDTPSATPAGGGRRAPAGPLGQRRLRGGPAAAPVPAQTAAAAAARLSLGRMSDHDVVVTLDRWMRDGRCPTAVIFRDALDFIRHFDHAAAREMAAALTRWEGLFADNRNVAILIFGGQDLEQLQGIVERARLCVIAAGYPRPMREFLERNPGLRSRFAHEIPFDDYAAAELLAIFQGLLGERGLTAGAGLEEALMRRFHDWLGHARTDFGNARSVRNLFDAMLARQADRLARQQGVAPEAYWLLTAEDLP